MNCCNDCGACKRIYRRSRYSYWQYRMYYCAKWGRLVTQKDGCNRWEEQEIAYDLSSRRFDAAEEDLRILLFYLNEP